MEPSVIFFMLAGAAVAAYLAVRKSGASRAATITATPSPAVATVASPTQRLQELSERLNAIGEASAHPRDVADNATFLEAIEIFAACDAGVLTDYISGANWMLAAAACVALVKHDGRQASMDAVLGAFRYLRPWPLYYALRYFEWLESPPPVGALVLHVPDWWSEHPFVPAMLGEHFAARRRLEETPSFGGGLSRATPAELSVADALLRKIDGPSARLLLDALTAFRRTALDRDYLQTFGRFIQEDSSRQLLVEHDGVKEQLAQAETCLLEQPHRSLLVVGEPRSGKSSFLTLLVMRAEAQGWIVFEAGGPQLQAGQEYIGQLEERLRRLTSELAAEKHVLWLVPDFLQLAVSGTHKGQTASLLDQVLPAIASGRVVLLSEITPSALTRILQARPALRTALELVRLRPITDAETHRLADAVSARIATALAIDVDPDVLEIATHLARYYLGAGHMPGALLDLLKLSAQRAAARDDDPRLTRGDILATMAQLTGMPQQVLDDRQRVDLAVLRTFFSSRVIGQDEAVEAVVGRVAMLKAGLTDPGKPVGVFLFAGPTGTGKTELAKTLAEFLFGSADRLIRLDMSEFQSVDAIRKIVGDAGNADETQALVDRVRKQPFSVVLLDEFEKAHPNAWDLFLQVFDDGRLTDAHGQTVDFRHCIIILTSNLGSTIKQDAGAGFVAQEQALSAERVKKAINQSFRPEFVNRLDRIIVFRALTRDDMRRIVTKELSRVLERRGLRHRDWAVEWEASALEFLLDAGFSPAMGARPLKRAIDEHLLAPLAATLVEHRFPEGDQFLFVRSDGRSLQVEFVDPDAPADSTPRPDAEPADATLSIARMMVQPSGAAAETAALAAERARLEEELAGGRWTEVVAGLTERMQHPDFWNQPDRQAILSRFEVMDRVKAAVATATGLSARLERSANVSGRYSRDLVSRLASQLFVVRHGIEDALSDAPVEVVLAVQPVLDRDASAAVTARWCERLLDMYRAWSARRGMRIAEIAAGSPARALLVISGFGASRLLGGEAGLHVMDYEDAAESGRAVARVIVAPTPSTLPRSAAEQHAALTTALERASVPSAVVRRYRLDSSPLVRDLKHGWRTGRVDLVFSGNFDVMGELSPAGERD